MTVRVRVNEVAIKSIFWPGGGVHTFSGKVARSARYHVRREAPKRTGALRRSVHSDRRGTNQYRNRVTVWVAARHALWVLAGTRGKTMPPGRFMVLYARPRPIAAARGARNWVRYRGARASRVAGQDPNNFLERGMDRALHTHRLL